MKIKRGVEFSILYGTTCATKTSLRHPGMGEGLLAVKSGFILFIKSYQFPLQINTLERERERENTYIKMGDLKVSDTSGKHKIVVIKKL